MPHIFSQLSQTDIPANLFLVFFCTKITNMWLCESQQQQTLAECGFFFLLDMPYIMTSAARKTCQGLLTQTEGDWVAGSLHITWPKFYSNHKLHVSSDSAHSCFLLFFITLFVGVLFFNFLFCFFFHYKFRNLFVY